MARLNLTVPDALYERLERFRDRVNVSKICASALAKELDMIEETIGGFVGGTASSATESAESKVQRLLERFRRQRQTQELWRQRGRADGETWAIERATVEELRLVGEEWDDDFLEDADDLGDLEFDEDEYPTLNLHASLDRWTRADAAEMSNRRVAADWREYVQGWREGVQELWQAARRELQ